MKLQTKLLGGIIILALSHSGNAAVSFFGSIVDNVGTEATRWDTNTVIKTMDADSDNRYGSYTAEFFGVVNRNTSSNTLTYVNHTGAVAPGAGTYVVVDNGSGGSAEVDTITSNGTKTIAANLANIITYEFAAANIATLAANGVRIGAFTDGLDGAQYTGDHYTLEQIRGGSVIGSATVDLTANNSFDAHFFDVTDVQTGDQIRFSTAYDGTPAAEYATMQGFTADIIVPVPEPTTTALLGLGGLAIILRRRR